MGSLHHTRTAEDRQAEAEELHATIVEHVQHLADSWQWRAFLDFARSFHTYSLNNLLLILAQNPDATMVAGFRQWQAKGRQVRKGEKAIKIFGHQGKSATTTTTRRRTLTTRKRARVVRYFPTLSVFDISQTDPVDEAAPLPANPTRRLTGDDDHGLIAPLTNHLTANGWNLHRAPLTRANGYTNPQSRQVTLAEGLPAAQEAKTLLHEMAHIELAHIDDLDQYRAHRGRMEVEAESVAYIVAGLHGFDTSEYSIGYIAGWTREDTALIRETASRVLTAARTIAEALDHQR